MDLVYQRRFEEVEITITFPPKLEGLEKIHQENSVQPMLAWKWTQNDDDYDDDVDNRKLKHLHNNYFCIFDTKTSCDKY